MKYQLQPILAEFNNEGFAIKSGYALVYNTDPTSGEYLHASYEYVAEGLGVPQSVCLDAPKDVGDEYAIVRKGDKWTYPTDHRNKSIYSTETGAESTVTTIGDIPDGFTLLKPTSEFDSWNGKKWVLDEAKQHQHEIVVAQLQQSQLLKEANNEISNLQDAVDAEIATEQQVETLKKWKKYRFELNQIDVNKAPDIDWPTIPDMS